MSRKTQGGISHSVCMAYFLSLGYIVSYPLFDDAPYDLLVDDYNDILKIQCKTDTSSTKYSDGKNKYPRIHLTADKDHKPVNVTSFDYMWMMTRENCYLIPSDQIPHNEEGTLRSFSVSPKHSSFIVSLPFLSGKDPVRPMFQSPLTESEVSRAISLFESGETYASIGMLMGVPSKKVEHALINNNVRRNHSITDEIGKKISESYSSGVSIKDIADEIGFSPKTVSDFLKRSGVKRFEPAIKPEWKPEIIELYKEGVSVADIAKKFGIKRPNTISTFLFRQKWLVEKKD